MSKVYPVITVLRCLLTKSVHHLESHAEVGTINSTHRKKRFSGFPFPSRDVTYQTLSRREYVSLFKPEVFPFPRILTESF
jgi:hypothetical protein